MHGNARSTKRYGTSLFGSAFERGSKYYLDPTQKNGPVIIRKKATKTAPKSVRNIGRESELPHYFGKDDILA